jgi:hypothetical protein
MPSDYAGNTLDTATVLQPSKGFYQRTFADRVDSVDPLDYYKFQVAGRSSLSVAIGQLSEDVTLNLLRADGTLLQSSANNAAATEFLSQTLEAGTYYLQVIPANGNSGSDYALDFALQNNPKIDIAWRHAAGYNAVWAMNQSGQVLGQNVPGLSDPNWQMVGVGDFNGDSQTDYLWRHLPTGQNALWLMNNGVISANVALPTVDPTWRINLAADLNKDGRSDILWQSSTGANAVWYMEGGRIIGADNFLGLADRNWTLGAAGDFNGDGQTDVVWRHGISGENVVWYMRRNVVLGSQSLMSLADQNWQLEGSGDFNGDGQSDLLWHHINTGQNVVWYLSGGRLVGSAALQSIDPSWKIMGVTERFEVPSLFDRPGSRPSAAFNLGDLSALNHEIGNGTVTLNDRVSLEDKDDYYSFTTNSYGAYTFNLTGLSADANLEILRSDVFGISSLGTSNNLGNLSESITQTLKPGIYYIKVSQNSGDTSYSLNLMASPARLQLNRFDLSNSLRAGTTQTITWTDNISENVKLELYKGNTLVSTIANSIPSTGSYTWSIPDTIAYGTDYQVLVSSTLHTEFRSFNGKNLTIFPIDTAGKYPIDARNVTLTTTPLEIREWVNGNDLIDAYRFTLTQRSNINVLLTDLEGIGHASVNLYRGISDLDFGFSLADPGGPVTLVRTSSITETLYGYLDPGTYFLTVSAYTSDGFSYGDRYYKFSASATPVSLQFTNITANQSLRAGSNISLTWQDNLSENVKLDLYRNGQFYANISPSTLSDGEYSWVPGGNLPVGGNYQLRIASVNDDRVFALSNSFSIAPEIYKYNFTHFFNGLNNTADYYTGWVYAEKGRYTIGSSVDVTSDNNQLGFNGRYTITTGTTASTITSNQLGQVFVDRYYDQDSASLTQYTPWKYSQNQASGTNYIGSEEDSIGSPTKPFADPKNFTDFGRDNLKFDAWEAPIEARYQVDAAVLGTQVGSYGTTIISPFGTKGMYTRYSSGGSIHWSVTTGAHTIRKQIEDVYGTVGGSGGFLGLPKTDQYTWNRGVRQDFEGGYIYHDGQQGIAFRPTETPVVKYSFTYFYSGPSSNSADYYNSDTYTGWTISDEGKYTVNQFLDVNSNPNETGKNGQYYITQATIIGKSSELVSQDRGKVWVNQYINQEIAETFTPLNSSQALGSNFLGSEYGFLETNNNIHFDFGLDAFEFDRFIRVDSPNTTQSINAGTSQVITWTDNINENVRIDLYQGNNFISNIANNVLSNGSFTWQLATTLSGSDFRIRVASMTNTTILDSSDVGFTIVGLPTIQVTSPNTSGIALSPGKNFTITWTDNFADNVKIELYQGNILKQIIASSVVSNGSYTWTLPSNLGYGSDYRIKISNIANANVSDFSDSYFSIDRPFNIQFDYRFDTNGWFTTERRAVLEAAADVWEAIILNDFADVPIGTKTPFVENPQTGTYVGIDNIFTTDVMIDDLLIFVGARDIPDLTLALGGSSGWFTGDIRREGNDHQPWIGSIAFDSIVSWFFDPTPLTDTDVPETQYDFLSTAIHEIGHVLGFSRDINAYKRWIVNNTFTGTNAMFYNGGNAIPLQPAILSHIQDGYTYGTSGETSMDPTSSLGDRIRPTLLDIAILDDIGYTVNYAAASQNPI